MNCTLLLPLLGALLQSISADAWLEEYDTPGNEKSATRKSEALLVHDAPEGHGFTAPNSVAIPLVAHLNSLTLLQLLSVVDIDPVASRMMATFHGFALPSMEDVAVADRLMLVFPNALMKYVGMLAVWVTLTAFGAELEVHVFPPLNMFRHIFVTVGAARVPSPELVFFSPAAALYRFA